MVKPLLNKSTMENKINIPKIIHLTWFSGEEIPSKLQKCIDSWKKLLPDFKIKLWTMEMARDLNIQFVNEALDARKWAFAGDVIRAYAIWKYGGVYMDTDIFLLKRFDELLDKPIVFFIETNSYRWKMFNKEEYLTPEGKCKYPDCFVFGRQIQAAMFMGIPNQKCLEEIVEFYKNRRFLDKDGNPDMSLISPVIYAKVLEKYGFLYSDKNQLLSNGICIYSSEYVANSPHETTSNTIAIHLAEHAWDPRTPWKKIKYRIRMTKFGSILNKLRYKLWS
ncbi:putative uncharacterized protein [Bacteroides sp. CAG:1076]|nr:putative uncharacterized protein [Bacteroides sp. CAG:1076]